MTFEENYQSRKTLLANQLTDKGINASDTEGMTTLINKVNDIQPETNNTLVLYTDKNVAENGEDIQLYALLLNNGTPVSGKTIMFFLNQTIDTNTESDISYNLYKIKGDGHITIANTTQTGYHYVRLNINNNKRYSVFTPPVIIKIEDSIIYYKQPTFDNQWRNYTGTSEVIHINDTDSVSLEVNVKSEITENTYAYGTAITNEYGIATLPYTCTGEGIQKITANYKNFISNSLEITDALFYDDGLTDAKWDTHYTGVTLNRQITNEGTELSSNGDYLYCHLSVNGEKDWIHENIQVDFDFTLEKINNPLILFYVGYSGYDLSSAFEGNYGEGHLRVILQDDSTQYFINNNKVTSQDNQYPTSLSFEIYRAGSITYKNLMIKKI